MYRVLHTFADLTDKNFIYHEGDNFPRDGVSVSEARANELSGSKNKIGLPLIAKIPDKKPKKKADHA